MIVSQIGRTAARVLFSPLEQAGINRKGRLQGYGNAIVPKVGATFVISLLEASQESA